MSEAAAPLEWRAMWAITIVRTGVILASIGLAFALAHPEADQDLRAAFLNGLGLDPAAYGSEQAQRLAAALAIPALALLAQLAMLYQRKLKLLRWALGLDILLALLRLSLPLGAVVLLLSFRQPVKDYAG